MKQVSFEQILDATNSCERENLWASVQKRTPHTWREDAFSSTLGEWILNRTQLATISFLAYHDEDLAREVYDKIDTAGSVNLREHLAYMLDKLGLDKSLDSNYKMPESPAGYCFVLGKAVLAEVENADKVLDKLLTLAEMVPIDIAYLIIEPALHHFVKELQP